MNREKSTLSERLSPHKYSRYRLGGALQDSKRNLMIF